MSATKVISGGCQCGAIRYELRGDSKMLYACHCTDCQKQSSSAFGMSLIVAPRNLHFVSGEDRLRSWDTRGGDGEIKRCRFCPDCGTRISHGSDSAGADISIKAGTLDDTSSLRPVAQIWLRSAQPWTAKPRTEFRCYDEEPDDSAELARLWRERGGHSTTRR